MTRTWVTVASCFLVLASLDSERAFADASASRVAVVRVDSADALLRDANVRLRAELSSAGFEVVEVERVPHDHVVDPRAQVEAHSERAGSFATVALAGDGSGAFADVWISDHVTGKTVVRRLAVGRGPQAAAVLAIRALELLRASLLELAEAPRTHEPVIDAPADVRGWVEPALPHVPSSHDFFVDTTLHVGVSALHGTHGLGLAVGPSLAVSHGFWRRMYAQLSLTGPLWGPELERAEGSASVRQEFAAVGVGFATPTRPFGVFGAVATGVFHLRSAGAAVEPNRAQTRNVASWMIHVESGAVARLGARTALKLAVGMLLLASYPAVEIAGHEVGRAGAPSLSMTCALLVGL